MPRIGDPGEICPAAAGVHGRRRRSTSPTPGWSDAYFWATHAGAELDLFVPFAGRRLGCEVKLSSAPKVTRSMHVALEDLDLARIDVVHTGKHTFPLHERIRALSIHWLLEDLEPLR